MAELAFAKTFLSVLDTLPMQVSADHVEDPKRYPSRSPYILAKMPRPMRKPATTVPGQERSISVTLKSVRNPPIDLRLTSQPPTISVLEIKNAVAERTGIPAAKIRLLCRKKPAADSKSLGELVGDGESAEVEFSVMVIGGAAAAGAAGPESEKAAESVEDAAAGAAVLETPVFWQDLRSFLMQRLKDEKAADEAAAVFRQAWKARQ